MTITWNWSGDAPLDPANCTASTLVATEGVQTVSASCRDQTGAVGTARTLPISVLLPPNLHSLGKRYLGVRYTIGTADLTGGTFNAWFGPNHFGDAIKFYPAGW